MSRRVVVLGSAANEANCDLVAAWRERGIAAELCAADDLALDSSGDVVLGRLDVLPTLSGVEDGLLTLFLLEWRGVAVLNTAYALLAAHDKLLTARLLERAGVRHPKTVHIRSVGERSQLRPPVVLKPRFGSWGRDVFRCLDAEEARTRTHWRPRYGGV